MTNAYDYNRKTKEENEAILAAVRRHHNTVAAKGYMVIFTSLVGSQNYNLNDEKSDIDTFSFIYPSPYKLALGEEPQSTMFEIEDGHCEVKDIRIALHLLEKASPNSVEYFTSKYKIYNPIFAPILHKYLDDNNNLWYMIHCNYGHMLYAMAGMAHQLTSRNIPAGKRFAHALRLDDMCYHFFNNPDACAILDLRAGGDRDLAMIAKRDTDTNNDENYNNECKQIADKLDGIKDNFKLTSSQDNTEQVGLTLINDFRWELFKKYIMETTKTWN